MCCHLRLRKIVWIHRSKSKSRNSWSFRCNPWRSWGCRPLAPRHHLSSTAGQQVGLGLWTVVNSMATSFWFLFIKNYFFKNSTQLHLYTWASKVIINQSIKHRSLTSMGWLGKKSKVKGHNNIGEVNIKSKYKLFISNSLAYRWCQQSEGD